MTTEEPSAPPSIPAVQALIADGAFEHERNAVRAIVEVVEDLLVDGIDRVGDDAGQQAALRRVELLLARDWAEDAVWGEACERL